MNEIKDVITLLKSRFPLIDKFEAVESKETISSKGNYDHIRALRENLEGDQVHQSSNTKYHYWNVFIVRIVEGSASSSTDSLTDLLSEISKKIVDDHQEQAEKNLLVLEEGGGLNIREVKVVV